MYQLSAQQDIAEMAKSIPTTVITQLLLMQWEYTYYNCEHFWTRW